MIKSKLNPVKKLSKKEQKAIVGGACPGGGYPFYCPWLKRLACPDDCL